MLDRSKIVCTKDDLTKLKAVKDVPMCCKDAVLPKPLLTKHTIHCPIFEENTKQPYNKKLYFFCALALPFHGKQKLEEASSKTINLFIKRRDRLSPPQLHGVHLNDIAIV